MKEKEMFELKPKDKVNHKHYGLSTVIKVEPDFGVVIKPDTKQGRSLLKAQSGASKDMPLLEIEYRLLTRVE